MSDSYERIQDSAYLEYQRLLTSLILEQEAFFSDSDLGNKKLFPDHIAVLLSKDADSTEMAGSVEWQGVLHAMKADVTSKISVVESKIGAVEGKIGAVEGKINALDQKLDLILSRFS